jgi:hypothetical protein
MLSFVHDVCGWLVVPSVTMSAFNLNCVREDTMIRPGAAPPRSQVGHMFLVIATAATLMSLGTPLQLTRHVSPLLPIYHDAAAVGFAADAHAVIVSAGSPGPYAGPCLCRHQLFGAHPTPTKAVILPKYV